MWYNNKSFSKVNKYTIYNFTSVKRFIRLYIKFDLSDPRIALEKINLCISDIRTWMIKNKLKINDSKTEFLVLSSSFFKQQFNDFQINVGNTEINLSLSARNLGVIFDCHLNLEFHINSVCRSAYFHLRNIRSIRIYANG